MVVGEEGFDWFDTRRLGFQPPTRMAFLKNCKTTYEKSHVFRRGFRIVIGEEEFDGTGLPALDLHGLSLKP